MEKTILLIYNIMINNIFRNWPTGWAVEYADCICGDR